MGKQQTRRVCSTATPSRICARGGNRMGPEKLGRRRNRCRVRNPVSTQEGPPKLMCLDFVAGLADLEGDDNGDSDNDESSVFSNFDVINDAIQEFLLESDDSDVENSYDCCSGDMSTFYSLKPFLNCSRKMDARRSRDEGKHVVPATALHPLHCDNLALTPAEAMPEECWRRERCVGAGGDDGGRGGSSSSRRRCRDGRPRGEGLLPPNKGLPGAPLCVVVDLDETLVSARREVVHPRPHLKEFLDTCHAEGCEMVVWSAGSPSHVNRVIQAVSEVSERKDWYHHVISRHRRWYREDGESVKDLSVLGRPVNRVLLLENSPHFIQRHPQNSVLLEDYVHPTAPDDSLRYLADVVRRLAAGMREAGDTGAADVSHLLSADDTLVSLLFPPLSFTGRRCAKGGVIASRGLCYSPQPLFSCRQYGGEHPWALEVMEGDDKTRTGGKRRKKKKRKITGNMRYAHLAA